MYLFFGFSRTGQGRNPAGNGNRLCSDQNPMFTTTGFGEQPAQPACVG